MIRKSKYTEDLLQPIVEKSCSMAEVLRNLGLKITGGNYRNIFCHIRYLNISITHFNTKNGQSWAKGKTKETDSRIAKCAVKNSLKDEEIFIENARPLSGSKIAKRLISRGWEYKCSECGLTEWRDKLITLHIDHINGVGNDNRIENLRFLCPNCHQQTETWGNSSKKKDKKNKLCADCNKEITDRAKQCRVCAGTAKATESAISNACIDCGIVIHPQATRCRSCASKLKTKIKWPDYGSLQKMVEESSFLATGRKLGVSGNAVRKRLNKSMVQ